MYFSILYSSFWQHSCFRYLWICLVMHRLVGLNKIGLGFVIGQEISSYDLRRAIKVRLLRSRVKLRQLYILGPEFGSVELKQRRRGVHQPQDTYSSTFSPLLRLGSKRWQAKVTASTLCALRDRRHGEFEHLATGESGHKFCSSLQPPAADIRIEARYSCSSFEVGAFVWQVSVRGSGEDKLGHLQRDWTQQGWRGTSPILWLKEQMANPSTGSLQNRETVCAATAGAHRSSPGDLVS